MSDNDHRIDNDDLRTVTGNGYSSIKTEELERLRADLSAATERAQKAEAELAAANKRWTMWRDGAEAGFVFNQMRKLASTLGISEADFRPYKFIDAVAKLKTDAEASETARKLAVEALTWIAENAWDGSRCAIENSHYAYDAHCEAAQALAAQPDAAPNAEGTPTGAPAARPPA